MRLLVLTVLLVSCNNSKDEDLASSGDPVAIEKSAESPIAITVVGSCTVPAVGNVTKYCKQYGDDFQDIDNEKAFCSGTWTEEKCSLSEALFLCTVQTTSSSNAVETKSTVYYSDSSQLIDDLKSECADSTTVRRYWEKF